MEGMAELMNPDLVAVFIPIVAVISLFGYLGAKAYFRHAERMEKIRNGIDPDAED